MAKPFPKVSMVQFLRSALSILKNPLPFHKRNFEAKGDTFQLKIGFSRSVLFSRDARFAQHALQKNQKTIRSLLFKRKILQNMWVVDY